MHHLGKCNVIKKVQTSISHISYSLCHNLQVPAAPGLRAVGCSQSCKSVDEKSAYLQKVFIGHDKSKQSSFEEEVQMKKDSQTALDKRI